MISTNEDTSSPIAVVGLACRFPGDAYSPSEFWDLLANGKSAFKPIPHDRLNINGHYHPNPERPDSFNFKGAHFLNQNVGAFDAKFFGVAPAEANAIDPQQRLLLEVTYEAIESGEFLFFLFMRLFTDLPPAGQPMESIKCTNTSVFIGSFVNDYEQISMRDPQNMAPDCAIGNGTAIMANRISYFFDLHGTSQTIDTGCSASLVCVHQAVNSLRSKQSNMAIAGGASLILAPNTMMPMTTLPFLSEDGKCFTFDSRANGYGRGEGVGIVVLKRLDDAIRDNNTIRAIIRGTASNQDGRTPGITVPNPDAQVRCIRSAYLDADLDPAETSYVECHGTGTKAGDWRELKAISEALCSNRGAGEPLFVGSAKPNIGHLEAAAGISGLIRAILIAEKGQIPPQINFEAWNPDIQHEAWRVDIAADLMKFPSSGLRRIGVNCFGFGGTNAHGVLDDARSFLKQRGLQAHHNTVTSLGNWELASQSQLYEFLGDIYTIPHLFVISAQHREGLSTITSSHLSYIENHATDPDFFRDYSYTMYARRSHLQYKSLIVAKSVAELTQKMAAIDQSKIIRSDSRQQFKPALVFCGQGAQWSRMGMELMAFDVFRESIEAADEYLRGIDSGFGLVAKLGKCKESAEINLPEVAQSGTTALQIALVDLLRACQIKPVAVVGHSSGEIAAAYAAGFLSREDAWKLAFHRGKCAAALKHLRGRMLAVALSESVVGEYIGLARPRSVAVACVNSPQLVTLSGDEDSILTIKAELDRKGIFNVLVATETAYHSHHMKLVSQQYQRSISDIKPCTGFGIAMYSSVTGAEISALELGPLYWATNLCEPVQFSKAVASMMKPSLPDRPVPNASIEVSPHRVWPKALKQILDDIGFRNSPVPYHSMLERGRDAIGSVLQLVGDLFLCGTRVDLGWFFKRFVPARPKCLVDLPRYPWDHSRTYWQESHISRANRFRQYGRRDFVGSLSDDAVFPFEPRWRGHFRTTENPWILDHKVQNKILYPAAGMVVMAIEAVRQVIHDSIDQPSDVLDFEVSQFQIKAPMVISTDGRGLEYFLNAKRTADSSLRRVTTWTYEFTIFSKPYEDSPCLENARGLVSVRFHGRGAEKRQIARLLCKPLKEKWRNQSTRLQSPFELYESLWAAGMNYGPSFRNIIGVGPTRASGRVNECWASIAVPNTRAKMPKQFEFDHIIHPATLDAMFQTVFTLGSEPMVPFYIESVRVAANIQHTAGSEFFGVTKGSEVGLREASADIDMWQHEKTGENVAGETHVVEVTGLRVKSIVSATSGGLGFLPSYRNLSSSMVWKEDIRYAEFEDLRNWLDIFGHKIPGAAILHVGESLRVISTVFQVLAENDGVPSSNPRLAKYTISSKTDNAYVAASTSVALKHRPLLAYEPSLELSKSDILRQFDLVIFENTSLQDREDVEKLVNPSGFLLILSEQPTDKSPVRQFRSLSHPPTPPHGTTDPVSTAMHAADFGFLQLSSRPGMQQFKSENFDDIVILTPHPSQSSANCVAHCLQNLLYEAGFKARVKSTSWSNDISRVESNSVLISLLDLLTEDGFVFNMDSQQFDLVKKLLQTTKGLLWVTCGAQIQCERPKNSPFLGWARTLRSEDPQKHIVCLDLQPQDCHDEAMAKKIQTIFLDSFIAPSVARVRETEYTERGGRFYIPRLSPTEGLNSAIEQGPKGGRHFEMRAIIPGRDATKLEVGSPSNVESLYLSTDTSDTPALESHQVRIQVHQTFLLPHDFEAVLGRNTQTSIGVDVAGTIVGLGNKVTRFNIGEQVVGFAKGSAQSSVVVSEDYVTLRPELHGSNPVRSSQNTSSLMATILTAYYSTKGINEGSSVTALVQAAAGPFGQAAIAVFQHMGLRVIAVVANDQQAQVIKSVFGLEDTYIVLEGPRLSERIREVLEKLDRSRSSVDLVFDSPGRGYMETNFSCVASFGRVFQVAARSADWENTRFPRHCFEFIRFDLHEYLGRGLPLENDFLELYDAVSQQFLPDKIPPSCHVFSFGYAGDALKQMEKDLGAGQYILEARAETARIAVDLVQRRMALYSNGIYVIIGGFGGLGLRISEWLVERGAGHVVLVSRTGAPYGQASRRQFEDLSSKPGAQIYSYRLDICSSIEVDTFITWLQRKGPKLRGVIHAAGILKDVSHNSMEYEDWTAATEVKTTGSWNLHKALPRDLDFLIFLSSAAGVIGNRGQANYAAGNVFQDALARHRTAQGMHTVSLDLGPVVGAGMVDQKMMDHLRMIGFFGLRVQDMLFMLERAISGFGTGDTPIPPQVVMGVGTGGLIRQNKPADAFWTETALFAHLNRVDLTAEVLEDVLGSRGGDDVNLQHVLAMVSTVEEGVAALMGPLVDALVAVIPGIDAADVRPHMTPTECHSDSMRGAKIDNWLKRATGVSIGQGLNSMPLRKICEEVMRKGGFLGGV
ncbi:hypothetical protein B0T26DRAFT_658569 [Lasiosphaeria miniovina]|uniref:Polyketide synthase n=1 Tax=Lasiosphaeria miniovina TaxID=1954250 RepID=A0AA40DJV4_9PEZI|nr:uncharacterized protein B0T26DRAFT_658569 [Lasiosphaeria miniovina]KAK0703447.1 hypothetical protein B0T26DRAFT_658569 [Lasiosphaeria miniovina]